MPHNISINILDKTYRIKCAPELVQELQEAAHFVDQEMRKVREMGKVVGSDKIAVLAAVNIAYILLNKEKQENQYIEVMSKRIRDLYGKIENVLAFQEEIDFD